MVKGKKVRSKKLGVSMSLDTADVASIESKVSESTSSSSRQHPPSPEKLASMGVVDLRMTRPPRPAGGAGITKRADDDISGMIKDQQKSNYQELRNSVDLVDKPPPAAKVCMF